MGKKVEANKKQKKEALLNTAFKLFTSKGIQKTSISDIVEKANVAKGTFYLYFSDKYDIRNKLISHKANQLLLSAYLKLLDSHITVFEDQIIFIVDNVIDQLCKDHSLLDFIFKNLSWGVFKNTMISPGNDDDKNIYQLYEQLIESSGCRVRDPEIMLFTILELVSGTSYDPILHEQPVPIARMKPYLYENIRLIIRNHYEDSQG
ncbi:MAG: TetR/AcrR family transcriptional regulator [Clostridiales bacterium]|nr:TetR/AcrR family transcriptional regulator [Clostridiales bacterium]